jgi:hypothetical protein
VEKKVLICVEHIEVELALQDIKTVFFFFITIFMDLAMFGLFHPHGVEFIVLVSSKSVSVKPCKIIN